MWINDYHFDLISSNISFALSFRKYSYLSEVQDASSAKGIRFEDFEQLIYRNNYILFLLLIIMNSFIGIEYDLAIHALDKAIEINLPPLNEMEQLPRKSLGNSRKIC